VQLISKIVTAAILYFGARLVIDGSLSGGSSWPSTSWLAG
jgi:ABC-type bacteriocin/lantibiotic exporter with double-glycine peptidase domain